MAEQPPCLCRKASVSIILFEPDNSCPARVTQLVSAKPDSTPAPLPQASCTHPTRPAFPRPASRNIFHEGYSWALSLHGQNEVGFLTAGFSEPSVCLAAQQKGHGMQHCQPSLARKPSPLGQITWEAEVAQSHGIVPPPCSLEQRNLEKVTTLLEGFFVSPRYHSRKG